MKARSRGVVPDAFGVLPGKGKGRWVAAGVAALAALIGGQVLSAGRPAGDGPALSAAGPITRPAGGGLADPRRDGDIRLKAGQDAPDFELSALEGFQKAQDGNYVAKVGAEKVKLSSFRAKTPVFLVFTSYT